MTAQSTKNNMAVDTPLKKRISDLMTDEEKQQPFSFATRVGISSSTFHGIWTKGSTSIHRGTAKKIADATGVDADWLHKGVGTPYPVSDKPLRRGHELAQQDNASSSVTNFRHVEDWDDDTPIEADEVQVPFYKHLRFACGDGSASMVMADEQRKLRMSRRTLNRLNIQPSNVLAAVASDGSMSPTINDGNTIFIDRGHDTIRDGKVFAIEHGGLFRCKRLYEMPNGGVRIVSDNDDEYPTIHLSADDQKDQHFCIVGWVFSWSVIDSW